MLRTSPKTSGQNFNCRGFQKFYIIQKRKNEKSENFPVSFWACYSDLLKLVNHFKLSQLPKPRSQVHIRYQFPATKCRACKCILQSSNRSRLSHCNVIWHLQHYFTLVHQLHKGLHSKILLDFVRKELTRNIANYLELFISLLQLGTFAEIIWTQRDYILHSSCTLFEH